MARILNITGPSSSALPSNLSSRRYGQRLVHTRQKTRICSGDPLLPSGGESNLEAIIRRKQEELTNILIDSAAVEDRITASLQSEHPNPHRFAQLVQSIKMTQGRPVLILELSKSMLNEEENLATLAKKFESNAADCLIIASESDSERIKDIFTVTRSVGIPVFARDWYIHPIQILEAKEAGASGVFGIVTCVTTNGTPLLSSYAAAIGMDAPVEVLNLKEVEEMDQAGVPMYCVNISVGLSLRGIAGAAMDLTKGILEALPFGAISVVGVKTFEEARTASLVGADALLIKHDFWKNTDSDMRTAIEQIMYMTSGDD